MEALCNACKKRPTCKALCEPAERYVNQDYVPLKEIPFADLKRNPATDEWTEKK